MSGAAAVATEVESKGFLAQRMSHELEAVILEVAQSERELDAVLNHAERLHSSRIQHDPRSCLVCFGL